jgi:predicted CXXCH cytochrome family protein
VDEEPDSIFDPGRLHTRDRIEVCARCHERSTSTDHPFASPPGSPIGPDGEPLAPYDAVAAVADPAPVRWLDVPASRLGWDQVGDFRASAHVTGEYHGACEDCHDPHGSEHGASLRRDPYDNAACTGCHAELFPDVTAEADHAHHGRFAPGEGSPGACVGCHLPRTGITVRADAVSGAGERHSHRLAFFAPEQSLAEFDAAQTTILPRGSAPIPSCLECHLQADALAEDSGGNCPCAVGDPIRRETYEGMQVVYELIWGGSP